MNYKDRHAIITGGSSGIGKATAKLLVQQGANISIIARDRSKLATAKQEIQQVIIDPNQYILTLSADVAQPREIDSAINKAITQLGSPDLLITAAGIARPGYFADIPIEVFENTMAVNYFGSLYSIRAVLPAMERQSKGQIVLIASGAALIGIYGYTAYCPSKFALRGLGESLRGELKPKGIRVAIVYPPDTDTPQLAEENKTKPPATKRITATAAIWTPEAVARQILQGVENRHFTITPGWEMTILSQLHSLIAPVLNWYFDQIVDKQ
ncbi:MAG: SDR family oxidoreductase [Pleurocapsa sp.]